jgi:hypothetical protein
MTAGVSQLSYTLLLCLILSPLCQSSGKQKIPVQEGNAVAHNNINAREDATCATCVRILKFVVLMSELILTDFVL